MQVAMLGPLEVRTDGDPAKTLEVGGVRLRALLIMLALRPGQFVPASQPRVRILATSREPLNITGEALWTVGPLTLPPDPAVTPSLYAERPYLGVTPHPGSTAGLAGVGGAGQAGKDAGTRSVGRYRWSLWSERSTAR